jgi:hypothetical protein
MHTGLCFTIPVKGGPDYSLPAGLFAAGSPFPQRIAFFQI